MVQQYEWPHLIPDEAICEAFRGSSVVRFSARPNNWIQYRSIALEGLGWWLPLSRVLPLIGITPQMLAPVFNPHVGLTNFPGDLCDVPEKKFERYEDLGSFFLEPVAFQKLARVLGKSIHVFRENGGTGEHHELFIAYASGEVLELIQRPSPLPLLTA